MHRFFIAALKFAAQCPRYRSVLAVFGVLSSVSVYWLTPSSVAVDFVRHFGYWFTFFAFVGLLFYVSRISKIQQYGRLKAHVRRHIWGLCSVLVFGGFVMFSHVNFGPKVMMDEEVLSATAKSMHEHREVYTLTYGRTIFERFDRYEGYVDKRPWMYPFAVSLLHDVTGYRLQNPYILNACIGLAMLAALYLLGNLLAGRSGAILLPALWITLPLFHQSASGAGMDLLNVFLLVLVVIAAICYLRRLDASWEGLLALLGVLLAYSRYESVIFLPLVGAIIIWGWFRRGSAILSWGVVLAAPLLIGLVLQNKFFVDGEERWELHSGATKPFGLENIPENLVGAYDFYFHTGDHYANSLFLSIVGAVAICLLGIYFFRNFRSLFTVRIEHGVACLTGVFCCLHFLIILLYHDGRLDMLFASRFSLPFYLLMGISAVVVLSQVTQKVLVMRSLVAGATVFVIGFTIPMNAKAVFTHRNFVTRQINWVDDILSAEAQQRSMIIDAYSLSWTLREYSSISPAVAVANIERLANSFKVKRFAEMYLVDVAQLEVKTGSWERRLVSQMPLEKFDLELLGQRSFKPFTVVRLYRINGFQIADSVE